MKWLVLRRASEVQCSAVVKALDQQTQISRVTEHRNYIVAAVTVLLWQVLAVQNTRTVASELLRSNPGLHEISRCYRPVRMTLLITSCCLEPLSVHISFLRLVACRCVRLVSS